MAIWDCGGEDRASGGITQAEIEAPGKDGNDQPVPRSHPESNGQCPPAVFRSQPEATRKGAFRVEVCMGEGRACVCRSKRQVTDQSPSPSLIRVCTKYFYITSKDIFKGCVPERREKLSIYCAFVFGDQGFPGRMLRWGRGEEGSSVPSSWGVYGYSAFLQDLQAISVS